MNFARSRHAAPIFHRTGQEAVALQPMNLGGAGHDGAEREDFVQNLVHLHPDVLPMADIEPAFMPLVSVCRELPTSAGYLDNLWITPEGGLILGECKLFKNPQARREVIVQALDYARAISQWGFEELERAVRKALKNEAMKLWDLVAGDSTLTESQFVDAIERRLRIGSFMILVIGDGIQEGVEALSRHLQLHAGMHAGLALVDLSIWKAVDGGMLIVPRIPMKTLLVERGVVKIEESGRVRIDAPDSGRPDSTARAQSTSETEFYQQLEQKRPELVASFRTFVDRLSTLSVLPEPGGKSLYLRWQSPDLGVLTVATVESNGAVWFSKALSDGRRLGVPDIVNRYVADAIGSGLRADESGSREVIGGNGASNLRSLLGSDKWYRSIADLVSQLETRILTQN